MENVKVLVRVEGGVAEAFAGDFVTIEYVDIDNIKAGDPKTILPKDPAWRALVARADCGKWVRWTKGEES